MQITEGSINSVMKQLGINSTISELKNEGELVPYKLQYIKKYLDLINYKQKIIIYEMKIKFNKTQHELINNLRKELKDLKTIIENGVTDDDES